MSGRQDDLHRAFGEDQTFSAVLNLREAAKRIDSLCWHSPDRTLVRLTIRADDAALAWMDSAQDLMDGATTYTRKLQDLVGDDSQDEIPEGMSGAERDELLEAAKPILRQYDQDDVWTGDMWEALRSAVDKAEGRT